MDDQRVGAVVRALRHRRRWRQVDLATRAGVSASLVGRVERGRLEAIPLRTLRRVALALDARFDPILRWQGADIDRLLDARHAAMHEAMAALLGSLDGWQFKPEVSFSIFGERGIIDILAWHPGRRMLLVIELKTEIVDIGRLLGSMSHRRRLAPRSLGGSGGSRWRSARGSSWWMAARTGGPSPGTSACYARSSLPTGGGCVPGCATHRPGSTPSVSCQKVTAWGLGAVSHPSDGSGRAPKAILVRDPRDRSAMLRRRARSRALPLLPAVLAGCRARGAGLAAPILRLRPA